MRKLVIAAALLAFVTGVQGQESKGHDRYKWKDAQGNLHYDDALPMEAIQRGYDVVNPSGMVIKHVDRAKTAEEQKADADAAAHAAKEKRAAEEQAKADQQLVAAYPNESDLIASQQAQIATLEQSISATQISLQSQEKSLSESLNHAAELDRTGKPVPPALQAQIEKLRKTVEQQKTYISSKQQEKADTAKKFEADLAHYRELRAKLQN